jgi:hypothetical protein
MKSYPESKTLKVLPLGSCANVEEHIMYEKQRRVLARRAELMNGYLSRSRGPGGMQLDPVLRAHLGLEEPKG